MNTSVPLIKVVTVPFKTSRIVNLNLKGVLLIWFGLFWHARNYTFCGFQVEINQ
jgi:hypothetical protein